MKANRTRPIALQVPLVVETDLVELDAQAVGIWLELLEDAKTPGRWLDQAIGAAGWQLITLQQENMMLGAVDRLIGEIRATRNGLDTPLAAQDPALDPFTLDLFSLRDVGGFLATNGESAAFILATIRQLLVESAASDAIDSETLARIAAIVVGVV